MLQDLRFSLRLLVRERGFAITAIVTIALGIGLSTMVFAVVDGVLFRPLPYRDAARLVAVYGAIRAEDQRTMAVSYPDLLDWRAGSQALERLEGYDIGGTPARVRGADETTQVPCSAVTDGFFDLLGTQAAIGRTLLPEDFTPGAPPAAMISYRVWRGAFGGDPSVLGRTVDVADRFFTIVGVLPRGFVFPTPPRRFAPEVVIAFDRTQAAAASRTSRRFYLIGRLRPGASMAQAETELQAVAMRVKPLYPVRPDDAPIDSAALMGLRDQLTRQSKTSLSLVFVAAAAVFLIACLNVIGLLLAHGEERRRELAVRAAIGAGRRVLVRQLLVESSVLAAAGATAGWLVSLTLFDALVSRIPRWLQLLGDPLMDRRVVGFAVLLAALTVVIAGMLPALRFSADAPRAALAGGGRHGTTSMRGRHVLLLFEVALATLLCCAGSIMLRGWLTLTSQDSGMDADRLIAVRSAPAGLTDAAARARHNNRLADAVRAVPGVQAVAMMDVPLLQSAIKGSSFVPPVKGRFPGGMETDLRVTPNYFAATGLAIRMGRALTDADRATGVVISEAVARRYWPGRNPVGETIRYGDSTRQIVGVSADARDAWFDRPPNANLYYVWDDRQASIATVIARIADPAGNGRSAASVMADIRRAVRTAEPDAAITMLSTVEDLIAVSIAPRTFNTLLFAVFGAAGLIVALVGIYGLVSFLVARRAREMGIRLALGATARGLQTFVVSGVLRWVVGGVALGIGAARLCAQYLKPFVYQVAANDPATLALVAAALIAVAFAASYLPARRAARIDPMIALRAD